MKRRHLFEIGDLPWTPGWLRDAITDYLATLFQSDASAPLHATIAEVLIPLLQASGTSQIVDLCAGAGGPLPRVVPLVERTLDRSIHVTLTDRFPGQGAVALAERTERFSVDPRPIDARAIPLGLAGVRCIVNALHHFRPEDVEAVLASATQEHWPIAVFEPFERRPALAGRLALGGLIEGWRAAWNHRSSNRRLLLAFLPGALGWDGAVSTLRAYQPDELIEIARRSTPDDSVRWTAERLQMPWGGLVVLIGVPCHAAPQPA